MYKAKTDKVIGRNGKFYKVGFNILLSKLVEQQHKNNVKTENLNNVLSHLRLLIFLEHYTPQKTECTFFASAHSICTKITQVLSHKTSFKNFEINHMEVVV